MEEDWELPGGLHDENTSSNIQVTAATGKDLVYRFEDNCRDFNVGCALVGSFTTLKEEDQAMLTNVMIRHVTETLKQAENVHEEADKLQLRNTVKQLVWLVSQMLEAIQQAEKRQAIVASTSSKKSKKKAPSKSSKQRSPLLMLCGSLLEVLNCGAVSALFPMSSPPESFGAVFFSTSATLLESADNVKQKDLRECLFNIFCLSAKQYKLFVRAAGAVIHLLTNFVHSPSHLADILQLMASPAYDCEQFVGDVIREVGRLDHGMLSKDSTGTKSLATFLTHLGSKVPHLIVANISVLLAHLDGESYLMRNGIVQMIGKVLCASTPDQRDDKQYVSLFDILEDRVHDVSSYTRSKVLQTWVELAASSAIPMRLFFLIVDMGVDRLKDRTAQVRKSAFQLLAALLGHNPFSPCLKLSLFKEQLYTQGIELKRLLEASQPQEEKEDKEQEDKEEEEKDTVATSGLSTEELSAKKEQLDVLYDAVRFINQVHEVMPTFTRLLSSKTNSDVQEAIATLVVCHNFQIEASAAPIRKMLSLIWSQEAPVREAVLTAYRDISFGSMSSSSSQRDAIRVAQQLVSLTNGATLADLTSLEEWLVMMTKGKQVPSIVIAALWEIFERKVPATTAAQSCGALMVLNMIAGAKPEVLRKKVAVIVACGLDADTEQHPLMTRTVCSVLQKTQGKLSTDEQERRLSSIVLEPLVAGEEASAAYFPAAEQAIGAIFCLHPHPDRVAARLVGALLERCQIPGNSQQDPLAVAQLLFVVGHTAVKTLVLLEHLEKDIHRVRRERDTLNEQKQCKTAEEKSAIEAELAMGASQDYETEVLKDTAERSLMSASNLLGQFGPLVVRICADPTNFADETLQASAVLALCKLMCCDASFCEANLRLLFSILKTSTLPNVRSNCVIALGDLAFRFPNLFEPWSTHMYAGLDDTESYVRKNTLMVLSHLILNDMIKVKGPVSAMAKCLQDPEPRIADLSRLFFHELAQKGKKSVYNILPESISRLGVDPTVSEESFRVILTFLIGYVTTDRECESLVDKFCQRFGSKREHRQWRDVAFCLAQLSYSEKGIKKLTENYRHYQDKLIDDDVYDSMMAIAAKAKKFAKPEMKTLVAEFVTKLEENHTGLVGVREATENAKKVRQGGAYRKKLAAAKKKRNEKKQQEDEEEKEEDDNDDEEEEEVALPVKKQPARRSRRKKIVESSSEESEEESEEEEESESEVDELSESD